MGEGEKQVTERPKRHGGGAVRGRLRRWRTKAASGSDTVWNPPTSAGQPEGRDVGTLFSEELAYGRSFLFAPFVMALGAAWWFFRPAAPFSWGLWLYWAVALVAAVSLRNAGPVKRLGAGLVALFLSGAFLAQLETGRLATVMLDSPVTTHVTGVVDAREPTENGWRYVVRVIATDDPVIHRPPERVTLVARGKSPPVDIGGAFTGLARLSPPSGPALPGLVDFGFLSYFDGIGAVGFFYGAPEALAGDLHAPGKSHLQSIGLFMRHRVESLRDTIAGRIRAVLPDESGAFANAIITGQRRAMNDDTLDALRNAGLAHVIAISGLHMALAAGIFFSSLRLFLSFSPKAAEAIATKKLAAVAAIGAAGFYLAISGMQVSAQRAFIMLAIMLLAAVADRPAISMRNVALAGLVILVVSPSEAVGPGMQMSFAATLALIAGYSFWQRREYARPASMPVGTVVRIVMLGAFGILLTALIGGLSTAPIAMAHFQRIAGYGLLGNLLAMPIVTFLVMPSGLLAMLAMPLNLHGPFLLAMGWGLDRVIAIAEWVNGLGGALDTGAMPRGFLLLFLVGFMLLVLLRTRLRLVGLVPMAIAFALPAFSQGDRSPLLLVSEDGALVAIVTGDTAALSKRRPPSFIFDQWQSALAINATRPPSETENNAAILKDTDRFDRLDAGQITNASTALAEDIKAARTQSGVFICEKGEWCVASLPGSGLTVAQIFRPALVGPACDHADIIISVYRPGFQTCRSPGFLITPALRRQNGTLQFTVQDTDGSKSRNGNTTSSEPNPTGSCVRTHVSVTPAITAVKRQWNQHRLYSWRSDSYADPVSLPKTLDFFSGSGGSGRQACPEP